MPIPISLRIVRRTFMIAALPSLLVGISPAQLAESTCAGAGKISLAASHRDPVVTFTYRIGNPDRVSSAWLEVWDRPTMLFRKSVPAKSEGSFAWRPGHEAPHTPSELEMALVSQTVHVPPSFVLVGITRDEGGPVASLVRETRILEEQRGSADLSIEGKLLTPNTSLLLMQREGNIWIAREDLPVSMVDFSHLEVPIPSGYLEQPTLLGLEVMPPGLFHSGAPVAPDFNSVRIFVVDKDRPQISELQFAPVPASPPANTINAGIRGSSFRADSKVTTMFGENGTDLSTKTQFISSSELAVSLFCCYSRDPNDARDNHIWLWVQNGDDLHVSDPTNADFLFAAKPPSLPVERAFISSVSPYPIPLMDHQSPESMPIHVYGGNFHNGDYVAVSYGMGPEEDPQNPKLATTYVSPNEMIASLPRELWRHHRLSYRLIIDTSRGTCGAELWEQSDGSPF